VLIEQEDETIATWVQNMQKVGLFITLQQLKLKVANFEITHTRPTPF
jgi:hypothetical protein